MGQPNTGLSRIREKRQQIWSTLLLAQWVHITVWLGISFREEVTFSYFERASVPLSPILWIVIYRLFLRPVIVLLETGKQDAAGSWAQAKKFHPFIALSVMFGYLCVCAASLFYLDTWLALLPGICLFSATCHFVDLVDEFYTLLRRKSERPSPYRRLRFRLFELKRSIKFILAGPSRLPELSQSLQMLSRSIVTLNGLTGLTCFVGILGSVMIMSSLLVGNRLGSVVFVTNAGLQVISATVFWFSFRGLLARCEIPLREMAKAPVRKWSEGLRGPITRVNKQEFSYLPVLAYRVFWMQLSTTVLTAYSLGNGFAFHEFWVWLFLTAQATLTLKLYLLARNIRAIAKTAAKFGEWELVEQDVSMLQKVATPRDKKE